MIVLTFLLANIAPDLEVLDRSRLRCIPGVRGEDTDIGELGRLGVFDREGEGANSNFVDIFVCFL